MYHIYRKFQNFNFNWIFCRSLCVVEKKIFIKVQCRLQSLIKFTKGYNLPMTLMFFNQAKKYKFHMWYYLKYIITSFWPILAWSEPCQKWLMCLFRSYYLLDIFGPNLRSKQIFLNQVLQPKLTFPKTVLYYWKVEQNWH